jgi:flagellar basal body-associated protein FliL
MVAGRGNGWKIFGIIVIVAVIAAAIAAAAFFIGRGSKNEEGSSTTTTTPTQPAVTSPTLLNVVPAESQEAAGTEPETAGTSTETTTETATETTATTERYVVGEGEGSTPCIGGFRTTTRTTYYSDGSTDTTTVTEPCTP